MSRQSWSKAQLVSLFCHHLSPKAVCDLPGKLKAGGLVEVGGSGEVPGSPELDSCISGLPAEKERFL